jgi:uncharacterized C2H2 Zn-finger protein
MPKYLINPVHSFEQIKENYKLYLKTAFGTRYEDSSDGIDSFEVEREKLLNTDRVLCREPWIEPLPAYKSGKHISEITTNEIPAMDAHSLVLFKNFVTRGLINDKFPLYEHQEKMLKQAMQGKNCIITSGTGSGKTESFLLPLFASLIKEAATWKAPSSPYTINDWWATGKKEKDIFTIEGSRGVGHLSAAAAQRAQDISISDDGTNDEHIPAIRAVILYPMNALVEDQMTRLREALDNDAVQEFMDSPDGLQGNRLFFGRYNGTTPVSGFIRGDKTDKDKDKELKRERQKIYERLKESMETLDTRTKEVMALLDPKDPDFARNKEKYKVRRSISPLLYGKDKRISSEMRSRMDMQVTPPDILITNYSMLAVMMMREVEEPMLEKTKNWLNGDPDKEHPTRIFHLIIDELHLNRGTAGTEIAYLIRLLLDRLGLNSDSKQLRILSSSASLDVNGAEEKDSLKYLKEFFGCYFSRDNIIEGVDKPIDETYTGKLPVDPFKGIKELFDTDNFCFEEYFSSDNKKNIVDTKCSEVAKNLKSFAGIRDSDAKWQSEDGLFKLLGVLNCPKLALSKRIVDAFDCGELGKNRAVALSYCADDNNTLGKYFDSALFDGNAEDIRKAAEGLIIARGLFDIVAEKIDGNGDPLYPTNLPRFRFHYFFRNTPGLWATLEPCDSKHNRPVGKLHADSTEVDGTKRVEELLYCENCGTVFYGGKRYAHVDSFGNNVIEMLPTNSNVEELPEQSTQLIVEKRKYADYVIFYPIDPSSFDFTKMENKELEERDVLLKHRMCKTSDYNQDTKYDCEWKLALLDVYSGTISFADEQLVRNLPAGKIAGYVYVVNDLDNDLNSAKYAPALPTHCPYCAAESIKSPYRPASLRGFRTGFGKSTQLFAKEMFYQLPTVNKPKLVSFSDSREDAAQVANDIEREQYRDIIRDLFVEVIKIDKTTLNNELGRLLWSINTAKNNLANTTDPIGIKYLQEDIQKYEEKIQKVKISLSYTKFDALINNSNFEKSKLFKLLINLGVNPAGCDWDVQQIRLTGSDPIKWYNVDFSNPNQIAELKDKSIDKIRTALANVVFGKLYFGIESAGIGYVTILPDDNLATSCLANNNLTGIINKDAFFEIIASCIRILGEKNKYVYNDYELKRKQQDCYNNLTSHHVLRSYVRACCKYYRIPCEDSGRRGENDLSKAIEEYLDTKGHKNLFLNTDHLYIRDVDETDVAYKCPRCNKIHLHKSGGVCCNCGNMITLNNAVSVKEIREHNYLMLNRVLGRKACKLHCEELTGQTDDSTTRQNEFRDIITVPKNTVNKDLEEKVRSIDLLSVTTTLEVGVDIGPLQGVFLANMPPQRFNYQQRVGRGGRRGQAYSLVMTLCRSRSHDNFYYDNPQKITGDRPPVPFLSITQMDIAQRLFAKEVLYKAFHEFSLSKNVFLEGNTHGEFGKKVDWSTLYKDYIKSWLSDVNHVCVITQIANVISPSMKDELVNYATDITRSDGLFQRMVNTLEKTPSIVQDDIAECLAEAGILPMYGMPTRTRNLFMGFQTSKDKILKELSSTDRDLDMAITSFAPNSTITKDKKLVTSIGFSSPSLEYKTWTGRGGKEYFNVISLKPTIPVFPLNIDMYRCENLSCQKMVTFDDHDTSRKDQIQCNSCGCSMKKYNLRTPSAFVTDMTPGDNIKNDMGVIIKKNAVMAQTTPNNPIPVKRDANYQVILAKQDFTWRINENSIEGYECEISYNHPLAPQRIYANQNQWIAKELNSKDGIQQLDSKGITRQSEDKGYTANIWVKRIDDPNNNKAKIMVDSETINLASRKVTNVIRLTFVNTIAHAQLNPFVVNSNTGKLDFSVQGVRAAYYSLAFILQRAIASKLDVDPEEIDVAELTPKGNFAEITLADELVNGSGFVNDLYDNFSDYCDRILNGKDPYFKQMLSDEHRKHCDSSCYQCLQMYRNMPYHGLLDWRLGVSLLRLMGDTNYKLGTDGNFEAYPELKDWQNTAKDLLEQLRKSYYNDNYSLGKESGIPYIHTPSDEYIVAVHPLWSQDISKVKVLAKVKIKLGNKIIHYIDTFNLMRRVGLCYEKLPPVIV